MIHEALKKMRAKRANRLDEIPIEARKYLGEMGIK